MSELLYRIAITKIPKVGAMTAKNLVSYCGSAEGVFKASRRALQKIPLVGAAVAENILSQTVLQWAEKELLFLEKHDIQAIFHSEKTYPQRLVQVRDAPFMVYVKGSAALNHPRTVGIVGTRKPTRQGVMLCEKLVEELQLFDVQIISGLAFGVDVAAHRRSVALGIETIGVLGHGLKSIYPKEHADIATQMSEGNGALLTEYASDESADREHFPMRNRIIAGMSDAVVVVETGDSGGSMITAYLANDYNRDLFAFPSRVGDKQSSGCNALIKSQRAQLIENAADLAAAMRWDGLRQPIQPKLFITLTPAQEKVMAALQQQESVGIDALTYSTELSPAMTAVTLLELEFEGLVKTLPGKRYMAIG
jgi:DNA processing protein